MSDRYILNDAGEPEYCENLLTWAKWMESNERAVEVTTIGEALVSTVFLGLDHSFRESVTPVLWETMIFGGERDGYQERYTSRDEAILGHQTAVDLVKGISK